MGDEVRGRLCEKGDVRDSVESVGWIGAGDEARDGLGERGGVDELRMDWVGALASVLGKAGRQLGTIIFAASSRHTGSSIQRRRRF